MAGDQARVERKAYSQVEVAELLGKAPETIARWIAQGKLRAVKVARSVMVTEEELARFLEGGGTGET